MLATPNDKQNDPHDAIEISPDVVLASRTAKEAPDPTPEIAGRIEPKIQVASTVSEDAPSVDKAVRDALGDFNTTRKRSSMRKWFRRTLLFVLFASGSAAAAVAWQAHGYSVEAAMEMATAWMPSSAPQVPRRAAEQPVAPTPQAAADQAEPTLQQDVATTTAMAPDVMQSLQSMTSDLAALGHQIKELKADIAELKTAIAELKTSQEQMARETAKAIAPKPAETRPVIDPQAKISAIPPHPPAAPAHKPKPARTPTYTSTSAFPPVVRPPPSQAATVPPPPVSLAPAPESTADDFGPVVRPPSPVR